MFTLGGSYLIALYIKIWRLKVGIVDRIYLVITRQRRDTTFSAATNEYARAEKLFDTELCAVCAEAK